MKRYVTFFLALFAVILLIFFAFFKMPNNSNKTENNSSNENQPTQQEISIDEQRSKLMSDAKQLAKGYFYDEAIELLSSDENLVNEETTALAEKYEAKKDALVEYTGDVYHVFFHSLIIYPELAFDGEYTEEGYNMWMTTVDEFKAMLPLLQKKGFVLYDFKEFYETKKDGTVVEKPIYLPKGKKPLILSVDDVAYYEYMKTDGFAQKLVINKKGDVVTKVITPEGKSVLTYDGDVFPIVDQYVKKHPEFSYRGAKGIIACTGYQGALGYRISDLKGNALKKALKEVNAISDRLKETGWHFASHSYTHNNWFQDLTITMDDLKYDTERWKKYIAAGVGDTDIFISPFGMVFTDERYDYLVDQGFKAYCPVSKDQQLYFKGTSVMQGRYNLDGYHMYSDAEYINKTFFDVSKVIDKRRPAPSPIPNPQY